MALRALIWAAVSTRAQTSEDKFSLPQQESDARDLCAREGWHLVEVLRVPGHTRSAYMEFHKLAAAAERRGITAFARLREHWEARDFDVLIIRDGDRLARAQGVMGTIVESVIRADARIYCFADGWVDKTNFRMWIAMVGYRAASDIDKLRKFIDAGLTKRAESGLPVGSSTIWSHKIVRGENGKMLYHIPDPDKALFFQDAAALILEGVSWYTLEHELFERFGHGGKDGKPYPPRKVYSLIYNPAFWGNSARFFRDARRKSQFKGAWAWDETVPAPPGVMIFYGVHQPVYAGALARQIQQEILRRESIVRGTTRAANAKCFTGLLLCGECASHMTYHARIKPPRIYPRYYCQTRYRKLSDKQCTQFHGITEADVQAFVHAKLSEAIQQQDIALFIGKPIEPPPDIAIMLRQQVDTLSQQARRLIEKQAAAPDSLRDLYDEQIEALGAQVAAARERLAAMQVYRPAREDIDAQQRQLDEIAAMTLERFWKLPSNQINQHLHALMRRRRWVVLNGEIVDQLDAPPRKKPKSI